MFIQLDDLDFNISQIVMIEFDHEDKIATIYTIHEERTFYNDEAYEAIWKWRNEELDVHKII